MQEAPHHVNGRRTIFFFLSNNFFKGNKGIFFFSKRKIVFFFSIFYHFFVYNIKQDFFSKQIKEQLFLKKEKSLFHFFNLFFIVMSNNFFFQRK